MSDVVVITGASGFMGRHAAQCAAAQGYLVVGIGHGDWKPNEWRSWGLSSWHRDDITVDALLRCAGNARAILHFAGGASVGHSISNPLQDCERTVQSTSHVLEYVRKYSPKTVVVYSSSAGVYGVTGTRPILEQCPRNPISPYGVHKAMAEQLFELYARQFQVSASIVRFFSVYGRGLRKQLLWDACKKLAAGDSAFMGTGREIRDWLHVEDAVKLMLLAADKANPGCPVANGGSGTGVSVQKILTRLAETLDPGISAPQFSGATRVGDPPALVADISRVNEWGWKPSVSWSDGVAEYANWWKQLAMSTFSLGPAIAHK